MRHFQHWVLRTISAGSAKQVVILWSKVTITGSSDDKYKHFATKSDQKANKMGSPWFRADPFDLSSVGG